jgi:hypothetical protein
LKRGMRTTTDSQMAGIYRTFIADPLGALSKELARSLQLQLANLFSPCTSDYFESNRVYFASTTAKPVGHELLVYFMPANVSVIKNVPNMNGSPNLSADGATAPKSGASEVYVKSSDPIFLAKLAFHELMHNRLKLGDAELHPQGGLAAASISSSTPLTTANIEAMARVISDPIAQWTEGIDILTSGRFNPISEYYQAR